MYILKCSKNRSQGEKRKKDILRIKERRKCGRSRLGGGWRLRKADYDWKRLRKGKRTSPKHVKKLGPSVWQRDMFNNKTFIDE